MLKKGEVVTIADLDKIPKTHWLVDQGAWNGQSFAVQTNLELEGERISFGLETLRDNLERGLLPDGRVTRATRHNIIIDFGEHPVGIRVDVSTEVGYRSYCASRELRAFLAAHDNKSTSFEPLRHAVHRGHLALSISGVCVQMDPPMEGVTHETSSDPTTSALRWCFDSDERAEEFVVLARAFAEAEEAEFILYRSPLDA